jgi:hypothetical protein
MEWRRVACVLDIMYVVGYLWAAAKALCGGQSKAAKRWVQQKLTAMFRLPQPSALDALRRVSGCGLARGDRHRGD